MNILVIGGAGYIGSHVCCDLLELGHNITVFDNLSKGTERNIFEKEKFIKGDILNLKDLDDLFSKNKFDIIFHFAALKAAGESMFIPENYSTNNITGTLNILNKMIEYKVDKIIFSSSAAIFGNPEYTPIDENHRKKPENYYGYTKLAIEENLEWYSKLKNIKFAALRYFNACGYDVKQRVISIEKDVTNLIPVAIEALVGLRDKLEVFGNDYDTRDGSCIRDYIHVNDLADAHIKAMDYIIKNNTNLKVNLGQNKGTSVLEIVNAVEKISNKKLNYIISDRRKGDPVNVVASYELANKLLGWEPKHSDVDTIIKTTYEVYKKIVNE